MHWLEKDEYISVVAGLTMFISEYDWYSELISEDEGDDLNMDEGEDIEDGDNLLYGDDEEDGDDGDDGENT